MKTLYLILFLAFGLGITACSSNNEGENDQKNAKNQSGKAKLLGQKIPAPIVNMSEFSRMSKEDLRLARNTLFAKYGRVFKSKDLKDHFEKQDWYHKRPAFKQSQMNNQDLDLVNLILLWESKTEILLKERVDITGNGSFEDCFVLYNENKGTYSVIINDFSQEFDHFWGQNEDSQDPPKEWSEIQAKIVDINPEDFTQEVLISQRYDDWEDPGTHNVIIAFDDKVQVTELSSTNYDAGTLEFNDDGTITMQYSNCPEHTKEYRLEKGKVVEFDESIGPMPAGGCAACFSGDAMVSTSKTESKRISDLERGDAILTYNQQTGVFAQTNVKRILEVYHENVMTVSFGDSQITVTEDHPILTEQGWCSLDPETTMKRYGYENVGLLKKGAKLIGPNDESQSVISIEKVASGMMTYTISTLEHGDNFIVNGIVVGAETMSIEL